MAKNLRVEQSQTGTWIVRGDSARFGQDAILYEHYNQQSAENWAYEQFLNAEFDNAVCRPRVSRMLRTAFMNQFRIPEAKAIDVVEGYLFKEVK